MARPWSEVEQSEAFKVLPQAEQESARNQYFAQVVAPRVPENEIPAARTQFDQQTYIRKRDLPSNVTPSVAGGGRGGAAWEPQTDGSVTPSLDLEGRGYGGATAQGIDAARPRRAFGLADAVPQGTRRGGMRSEVQPFVAGNAPPTGAGGGRGFVNTADDAARSDAFRPLTAEQTGKDFQATVESSKALLEGARLFAGSAGYQNARSILGQFDRMDSGQGSNLRIDPGSAANASPVAQYARMYEGASPEARAGLRAKLSSELSQDRDFIGKSVAAINAYKKEAQKQTGRMPDFTDVESAQDFGRWLVRTGVANSGPMALSMAGAMLGLPGLAATSATMATGDLMGDVAERAGAVNDPRRFRSADRAADAAAAQPDAVAGQVADARQSVAIAAPAYAALDALGPEMMLARSMGKPVAARTAREVLQGAGRNAVISAPFEAVGEAGQAAVSIGTQMVRNERPAEWTPDDTKRLINEGAAGFAVSPMGSAAHAGIDGVRVAKQNRDLRKAAEDGDIGAAAELYARQRPTERRKAANDRLDDFAAEHGMPAKVVSAIKEQAEKRPLADVPSSFNTLLCPSPDVLKSLALG